MLRALAVLALLIVPAAAQTNCGTLVENQRVAVENRYRAGDMDRNAYQAARIRIEESAAACRAGQFVPSQLPTLPPPAIVSPPSATQPTTAAQSPTILPSQTTPQGLQIPSPYR
jgi:hypothetical protein